jgi:hypothetical protein
MEKDFQTQIDELKNEVQRLKDISIKIGIDPDTYKVLVNILNPAITSAVQSSISATQTYSVLSPSGSAPVGSIWFKNTGVLATNQLFMYDGSSWVQIK